MQYRTLGKTGYRVSALGFGCMRLPILGDDHAAIDEPEAARMIHYAIDHGVNYFDTGYPYHNGQSEVVLGRALQGGYRQRVILATKLLTRIAEKPEDCDRLLNEQLQRLQTDYIDIYLLHGQGRKRWDAAQKLDVLNFLDRALADGRVRAVGFSFHDSFPVFQEIINAYDKWSAVQFQYNYMNEHYQAGTAGLHYAAERGLGIVIMEPLLGGKLGKAPEFAQKLWDTAPIKRTAAEWALQWVWNHPEVSVALSGMSTMAQVEENIVSAGRSQPGALTADELALVERVRDGYNALCAAPCTGCGYCMPCPNGVDIPRTFSQLNNGLMFGLDEGRRGYARLMPDQSPTILASSCIQCRECEDKCPQNIPISDWMPYAHEVLGEGKDYDPAVCARFGK